jgi:hypothetical protein
LQELPDVALYDAITKRKKCLEEPENNKLIFAPQKQDPTPTKPSNALLLAFLRSRGENDLPTFLAVRKPGLVLRSYIG